LSQLHQYFLKVRSPIYSAVQFSDHQQSDHFPTRRYTTLRHTVSWLYFTNRLIWLVEEL